MWSDFCVLNLDGVEYKRGKIPAMTFLLKDYWFIFPTSKVVGFFFFHFEMEHENLPTQLQSSIRCCMNTAVVMKSEIETGLTAQQLIRPGFFFYFFFLIFCKRRRDLSLGGIKCSYHIDVGFKHKSSTSHTEAALSYE